MAQYRNMVIEQGETWFSTIYVADNDGRPLDLTDYIPLMSMKTSYYSKKAIPFTATISDPIKGEITVKMDASQTASIKPIRYVYDCLIYKQGLAVTDPVTTIRVMEGIVTVTPAISFV